VGNMHVLLRRLLRGVSFCKMSSPESLDLQSRFIQQIALEVIHVDGYNRCLDNLSADSMHDRHQVRVIYIFRNVPRLGQWC